MNFGESLFHELRGTKSLAGQLTPCTIAGARVVLAVGGRYMIEFFLTTIRLLGGISSAYRRDPEFRSLLFLVLITLLGGTIFYTLEEGWSVVDAFYFSVTTLTTVGLGDLSPQTTIGKLFTVVYIFAGIGIILGFIDTVAKESLRGRTGRGAAAQEGEDDAPAR
jgi:voltage-gated potassium channel Kch